MPPPSFHCLASSVLGIIHESQMTNLGLFPAILISDSKGRGFFIVPVQKQHTHTHTRQGQECDVLISSWLGCRFVCQLNNGLAGIKASHCHNYTPAGINPMYINVIIGRRVHTPERCISIRRDLLTLPPDSFLWNSLWRLHKLTKTLTSGVVKKWHHSFLVLTLEQLGCKHCDQQSRWILKLFW